MTQLWKAPVMLTLGKKEKILLGALVAGLAILSLVLPDEVGNSGAADSELGVDATQTGHPPVVRVELLAFETARFDPRGRDLFRFHEQRTALEPASPLEAPSEENFFGLPLPPRPDSDPSTLPEPPINYIGYLGPKDDLIAVFNGGTELVVARIGDVVDDRLELLEFHYEAVVLEYVSGEHESRKVWLKKRSIWEPGIRVGSELQ